MYPTPGAIGVLEGDCYADSPVRHGDVNFFVPHSGKRPGVHLVELSAAVTWRGINGARV